MVLAAGACGSAAPRAWAWIDPRPWISAFAERGRPLIGALWIPGPPRTSYVTPGDVPIW